MKDPFRPADKWIRCPKCGNAYGYNIGRGELPLRELSCACGYQFKSSDPRRKVCKLEDKDQAKND
jgi:hypothetical protein